MLQQQQCWVLRQLLLVLLHCRLLLCDVPSRTLAVLVQLLIAMVVCPVLPIFFLLLLLLLLHSRLKLLLLLLPSWLLLLLLLLLWSAAVW